MNKEFDIEPVYGDSDKYMKTKIKLYKDKMNTNFQAKKNTKRKYIIQMYVTNNARFCYQSKEKVLSTKDFGRIQI